MYYREEMTAVTVLKRFHKNVFAERLKLETPFNIAVTNVVRGFVFLAP